MKEGRYFKLIQEIHFYRCLITDNSLVYVDVDSNKAILSLNLIIDEDLLMVGWCTGGKILIQDLEICNFLHQDMLIYGKDTWTRS
jgi:hypothetical protein